MWDPYIWVNDARAMYAEMVKRGATIDYELHEKDYGILEFGLQDVDGESARRLGRLGGTQPDLETVHHRRSDPT